MGKLSKEVMLKANILPKLRLGTKTENGVKSTGKHHVTLVEEKLVEGKNFQGQVIPMMRYIFEENGEKKKYDAPLKSKDTGEPHYFVQSMSEVSEGEEVIIEMVKKGMKNVILVKKLGEASEVETDEDIEDGVTLDDIQ